MWIRNQGWTPSHDKDLHMTQLQKNIFKIYETLINYEAQALGYYIN